MKTISLTQPWASLVAAGAKQIETRSWSTAYRGPLAIHAAKGFPTWARGLCMGTPFMDALIAAGFEDTRQLPLGAVVAVVNLHHVGRIEYTDDGPRIEGCDIVPWNERDFGDFTEGRYGWVLTNIVKLETPVPAKGALYLWDWDAPKEVYVKLLADIRREPGRLVAR